MIAVRFLLPLFLISFGCKPNCDCYTKKSVSKFQNLISMPWQVKQVRIDSLAKLIEDEKYDPVFGYHFENKKEEYKFYFLSKEKELIEFDISRSSEKRRVSVKNIFPFNGYYTVLIRNDTIHYLSQHNSTYYQYKVNSGSSIQVIDSFDLRKNVKFKNCTINLLVGRLGLVYKWPFIWVQYGHLRKRNFIDSKAYFKINMIDKSLEKVIDYPSCYHCSYQYLPTSSLTILADNSAVCLFDHYDQIFVNPSNGAINESINLIHRCEMETYNKEKKHDLAYTRKYLENAEANIGLLNISDRYLVAIKREKKESLSNKPVHSIFVFDMNYRQIYSEEIPYSLGRSPVFFNSENGIVLFNDSLNKAYFYDFKR